MQTAAQFAKPRAKIIIAYGVVAMANQTRDNFFSFFPIIATTAMANNAVFTRTPAGGFVQDLLMFNKR
ncbi:MAG: hypothetical protein D6680_21550 [Cyanobacteria bacterium J007]|nr:MAG: hypothetical protein D6680_21550 [Cyanobacteria bacterium J007]